MEFDLISGITTGFPKTVSFGEIRAYSATSDNWYSLNVETGTWNLNGSDWIDFTLTAGGYSTAQVIEYDKVVDNAPFVISIIVVRLFYSDPDSIVDGFPTFVTAAMDPEDVDEKYTTKLIEYENSPGQTRTRQFTVLDDTFLITYFSDHEYYTGAVWDRTNDWSGDEINDYLAKRELQSSVTPDQIIDMRSYLDTLKLSSQIVTDVTGTELTYIPMYIKRSRKDKVTRIVCSQIKSEAIGALTIIKK